MREMKDSGIEWIGKIPVTWTRDSIKFHYQTTLGKMVNTAVTDETKMSNYLCAANVKWLGVNTDINKKMFFSEPEKSQYLLKSGDVLIMEGGTAGTACVYKGEFYPCYIQNSVLRCRPIGNNCAQFLYYWMYVVFYSGYVAATCNKATIMHYTKEKTESTPIAIPNYEEQSRIADYLDSRCAEIDTLSADIQAEINTLEEYKKSVITEAVTKGLNPDAEMIDSGIQWIGKMPSHWNCIRGKYILNYLQKHVREDDGVITCFRDGEVTLRSNRREDGFTMADKEIGYQGIDVGDLVVHGMDGFAGAIGISDSRGKASPVLNVLDTNMDKKYVMYYLRSMAYSDVFVALATGIRVRSCDLRWNKLAELFYPVPPKDEQQQISKYIDDTLLKTNDVIMQKKEQLATLDEYKKSLIYECVTGKKEVSG